MVTRRKKEKFEDDTWSLKTPEAGPSTSKAAPHARAHDNKDFGSSKMKQGVRSIPQSKLTRPRYESSFNGYCYFCSNFGHKAMDCRFFGRRSARSPNDSVRCWTCNRVGHVSTTCHTLRCYTCSGFGNKAQECASQRSQPRKSPSYTLARRTSEPWKKTNAGRFQDQKPTTFKDTLRYGDMKLIKEVLEVPTTQSGVGHATMLFTLLHIVI